VRSARASASHDGCRARHVIRSGQGEINRSETFRDRHAVGVGDGGDRYSGHRQPLASAS
jgi:hypothetical protein